MIERAVHEFEFWALQRQSADILLDSISAFGGRPNGRRSWDIHAVTEKV